MADLLKPVRPAGERWTLNELRELLGGEPTIERFDRGYAIAFVGNHTGDENVAVIYASHGARHARGPAIIMHMDEAPAF
jgi:hypothetical protein